MSTTEIQKLDIETLLEKVRKIENFEVVGYEEDKILVAPVKGIIKVSPTDEEFKKFLGEAKRRRPRGKPSQKQLQLLEQIVRKLVEEKTKFKITFEGKDIIVRFDIDHFVKITDKDIKVAGFQNENDGVLGSIYPLLSKYGKVLFLRVVK